MKRFALFVALALLLGILAFGCAHGQAVKVNPAPPQRPCVTLGKLGVALDTGTLYELIDCGVTLVLSPRSCPVQP